MGQPGSGGRTRHADVSSNHGPAALVSAPMTKPYEFIGFGAMEVTKSNKCIGFGAMEVDIPAQKSKILVFGRCWTGIGPVVGRLWAGVGRFWAGVEDICP